MKIHTFHSWKHAEDTWGIQIPDSPNIVSPTQTHLIPVPLILGVPMVPTHETHGAT